MPLELVTIPARQDNYTFLLHDPDSGATAVIDVPDAKPISEELKTRGWTLSEIWLTHHHGDHTEGVPELLAEHPAQVTGARADIHRLPPLDRAVSDGDSFEFAGETVNVLDVSGHTVGHIALHLPGSQIVFTADSLMALGCGRVFEGTPQQMWDSLSKLAALPRDTTVCSGHEYTQANGRFAMTIEPDNPALISRIEDIALKRDAGQPTVPSKLGLELDTNPFLRAAEPGIRERLNMQNAEDWEVFAEIRARKDRF